MRTRYSFPTKALLTALVVAGTLAAASSAYGFNKFTRQWDATYPTSNSDASGCQLCHGASTKQLNVYGAQLCWEYGDVIPADIGPSLRAIEVIDSDQDPSEATNLEEIGAGTQPGWRVGTNPLFSASTCMIVADDSTVPTNVPQPYDPADALLAIAGGPYTGSVGIPVRFDGSGSRSPDGKIEHWDWKFGDGGIGSGEILSYTYKTAGTYVVTLTVIDDSGATATAETTATISQTDLLDLDIVKLGVPTSAKAGDAIVPTLEVANNGQKLGQAIATITGDLNGVRVYSRQLFVYDGLDAGTTTFTFASYSPTASGKLVWTATIADEDPDHDVVSTTTNVRK